MTRVGYARARDPLLREAPGQKHFTTRRSASGLKQVFGWIDSMQLGRPIPVRDRVCRRLADAEALENGLAPEPRLHFFEHGGGFGAPELSTLSVVASLSFNLIQLTDPAERQMRLRMIGSSFLELSKDVSLIRCAG